MNWYVLYTKPRSEIKAAEQLLSLGINAYCPKLSEIKIWSDRKKRIDRPILPSMILVNIKDKDINRVFESPLVRRYMFWLGERAVVRQSEINILKKYFNGSHNIINYRLSEINVGKSIKLSYFSNEMGIVSRISNNNIWIYLKSLGFNVKLELA